jgi:predicted metal-dependent hydrolase
VKPVPIPRSPDLSFDADLPRHWFGGNPVATHLANGVNLLFPWGERFFVRSVRRYLDRIDDPELRAQVRGFFAQEGRHAQAHERYFEILEGQGYQIRPFLERYVRIAEWIERRVPPSLSLAVTVAHEHFTATLAELALGHGLLDAAHPAMQQLLLWHACEELEHKAVAFDVLQKIDPGFVLRMAGLLLGGATLGGFWLLAARELLRQDGISFREGRRSVRHLVREHKVLQAWWRGTRDYARRDFHPWQNDNRHLAEAYLQRVGLQDVA